MTQQEIKEQLYYSCCNAYYYTVSVVNYIAFVETLDAIDMLDDEGLLKQRTKQLAKRLEKAWKAYETKVRNVMDTANRTDLWFNYLSQMRSETDTPLTYMRVAIKNQLDKRKIAYSPMLCQLYLAVLLTHQACRVYDLFFETWREKTQYNFIGHFRGGRLTDIANIMAEIEREATKQLGIIACFSFHDKAIVNAYESYLATIRSDDIKNKAAGTAIDLTPSVADEVEAKRKEIRAAREQQTLKQ